MHYLVTGAAGFIASHVCSQLLSDGHEITGVDNLNDAYDVRLKEWRLGHLRKHPGFRLVKMDIGLDPRGVARLFSEERPPGGYAAVLNLAARAGVRQSIENPQVYQETNILGTLHLLEACRQNGVAKFLLASTSSLYGSSNIQPFEESANTDRVLSPYAASKKGAEVLCYTYHYLYGLEISIPRYFTVYGPAGRPDMSLFRFVKWVSEGVPVTIYGDGTQSRDFTYVSDIARGTIAALSLSGYEIVNLGSDRPSVLLDALKLVESHTGKKAVIEWGGPQSADVPKTWANIDKARRLLRWEPTVKLDEGIFQLVEWYRRNRDWAKDLRTE